MFYNPIQAKDWTDQLKQYEAQRKFTPKLEPYNKISYSLVCNSNIKLIQILDERKRNLISSNSLSLQSFRQGIEISIKNDLLGTKFQSQLGFYKILITLKKNVKKKDLMNKYEQDYNIINLDKNQVQVKPYQPARQFKFLPHPSLKYNIITNEHYYPQQEQQEKQDQMQILQVKYGKKLMRKFDIISNDNFNKYATEIKVELLIDFDLIKQDEQQKIQQKLKEKYNKTHDYNLLAGEFYDQEKEIEFQKKREEMGKTHGINFHKRLPPAWKFRSLSKQLINQQIFKNREPLILDRTKPLTDELKIVDEKRINAKKRYNLRYALENEYRDRDIDKQELENYRKLGRINQKKFYDEQQKGFDLITLENYQVDSIRPKNIFQSSWDQLQLNSHGKNQLKNQFSQSYYSPQIQQKSNFNNNLKLSNDVSRQPSKPLSQVSSSSVKSNQKEFLIKTGGFSIGNVKN